MSRRWINSLDVEYDPVKGSILTEPSSPGSLVGGIRIVASSATPQPLVETSMPCRFVWVGARIDDSGAAQNAGPVFLGDAAGQNIPIMPGNYEGMIIGIDDARKLCVRVASSGDGVAYRIFA